MKAVVAGHICLDITPAIPPQDSGRIQDILAPGRLLNVGSADIHTGGAVANTGLAMKILGADVTLAGKTGCDRFGDMIFSIAESFGAAGGLIRQEGEHTSYSIVLAVPGMDRIFLHDPGANDTFCAADIPMDAVNEAAIFHFGYPPIMKRMYEQGGAELVRIFRTVHASGTATSLDLAAVDPNTESGKADWASILSSVLPYVDIFVPSIEELLFMLDREKYEKLRELSADRDFTDAVDMERDVVPAAEKCIGLGAAIVLIKCGTKGMYLKTAGRGRISSVGQRLIIDADKWSDTGISMKCYKPGRILSATGAGDTSVAAFLTAMLKGFPPEKCVTYAAATGACCVSAYDALGGLLTFDQIDKKLAGGWEQII